MDELPLYTSPSVLQALKSSALAVASPPSSPPEKIPAARPPPQGMDATGRDGRDAGVADHHLTMQGQPVEGKRQSPQPQRQGGGREDDVGQGEPDQRQPAGSPYDIRWEQPADATPGARSPSLPGAVGPASAGASLRPGDHGVGKTSAGATVISSEAASSPPRAATAPELPSFNISAVPAPSSPEPRVDGASTSPSRNIMSSALPADTHPEVRILHDITEIVFPQEPRFPKATISPAPGHSNRLALSSTHP